MAAEQRQQQAGRTTGIKLRIKVGGKPVSSNSQGAPTSGQASLLPSKRKRVPGYPEPDASLDVLSKALRLHPTASPSDDAFGRFPAWEELVAEVGISVSACSGGSQQHGGHPTHAVEPQATDLQAPSKRARASSQPPCTGDSAACHQEEVSAAVDRAPQVEQKQRRKQAQDACTSTEREHDHVPQPMEMDAPQQAAAPMQQEAAQSQQAAAAACPAGLLQPQQQAVKPACAVNSKIVVDVACCMAKDESVLAGGVLSSSSGEATTFGLYASLSTSPPEVSAQLPAAPAAAPAPPSTATVQPMAQLQQPITLAPPSLPPQPAAAARKQEPPAEQQQAVLQGHSQQQVAPQPALQQHSQQQPAQGASSQQQAQPQQSPRMCSMACQTQECLSLLPPRVLPGWSVTAPAVGNNGSNTKLPQHTQLAQLMLPPHKAFMPLPADLAQLTGTDEQVRALMERAKDCKRQADRQRDGSAWSLQSLLLYVESVLLFMTAAECMLRSSSTSSAERTTRASGLCVQTADFIAFTLQAIEKSGVSHLAKDCLRALCERLTVVCLMRDCLLSATKLKDYAERLEKLMADSSRTAAAAGGGRQLDAGPGSRQADQRGGRPPLGGHGADAHHHHDATAAKVRHAGGQTELGILQARVVTGARQTAKWADYVRKSTCSFQALSEREETRTNETAMLACTHIAAVGMGGGFMDGLRAIAHAYQALACVKTL